MSAARPASELYQRLVLDHNKAPRHYGELSEATHDAHGHNPICGDVVRVMLVFVNQQMQQIQFTAQACALCRASASIMCDHLVGADSTQLSDRIAQFMAMIQNGGSVVAGDAGALAVTRDFPARAKCVLLPWKTLQGALAKQPTVTTESQEA